jgi:hypothetical protein
MDCGAELLRAVLVLHVDDRPRPVAPGDRTDPRRLGPTSEADTGNDPTNPNAATRYGSRHDQRRRQRTGGSTPCVRAKAGQPPSVNDAFKYTDTHLNIESVTVDGLVNLRKPAASTLPHLGAAAYECPGNQRPTRGTLTTDLLGRHEACRVPRIPAGRALDGLW